MFLDLVPPWFLLITDELVIAVKLYSICLSLGFSFQRHGCEGDKITSSQHMSFSMPLITLRNAKAHLRFKDIIGRLHYVLANGQTFLLPDLMFDAISLPKIAISRTRHRHK